MAFEPTVIPSSATPISPENLQTTQVNEFSHWHLTDSSDTITWNTTFMLLP